MTRDEYIRRQQDVPVYEVVFWLIKIPEYYSTCDWYKQDDPNMDACDVPVHVKLTVGDYLKSIIGSELLLNLRTGEELSIDPQYLDFWGYTKKIA